MNPETPILQRIRLAAGGRPGVRLFRNSVGVDQLTHVPYGLCVGSSDLIGWRTVQGVAVFVAVEVKTPDAYARPHHGATPEQTHFIESVRASGGIAGIAYSPESAQHIIESYNMPAGGAR